MASFCSSNDKCNFQWVTVASVDLIKLPLRDILASHIKPADLFKKIQSCSTLKLLPDQRKFCLIQPPGLPDYNTFDFTLLYTLIRNLCCLPKPAQGWGKEPKATDTEISDDIERLRLFRNNYYAHANSVSISDDVFEDVWRNLRLAIERFNSKIRRSVDYKDALIMIEHSKFTNEHFKTCRILLDVFASIQKQTNSKDEPDISIIGENEKKCGETALFEANVEMGKPPGWSITWQKRRGNIIECIDTSTEKYRGSTKRKLVIKSVCKEDEGEYQAVLSLESNGPDYRSKNTIRLYVLEDVPSVKIFVKSPVCFGSKTIIKSEVSPTTTPEKVEWQKSKDGIDFHCIKEPFLFRTTARFEFPSYVIPKTTFTDKLYYRLLVWNENGEGVSNTVYLDVTGINGFVDVQFHVQGDLSGYTKEFIREVIETVAAILDCKEEDIQLNAVRYSTSFYISLSIKKVYIRKLLALKEQDRLNLKNLNIDYLKIDKETIYLNKGEDNKMECRIRKNSDADVDEIETERVLREENNRKRQMEEMDSEEEHKDLLIKNDDVELSFDLEQMDLMSDDEDEPVDNQEKIQRQYGDLNGDLHLVDLNRGHGSLGINLAGNKDRNTMSVFVAGVQPEGIAGKDGRIQVGDELLEVNGQVLYGRSHLNASAIIKSLSTNVIKFVLLRRSDNLEHMAVKPLKMTAAVSHEDVSHSEDQDKNGNLTPLDIIQVVTLEKGASGLGFAIVEEVRDNQPGIFIRSITPGGVAAQDGQLSVGDQILEVGDKPLTGVHYEKAIEILRNMQGTIKLKVRKNSSEKKLSFSTTNHLDPEPGTKSVFQLQSAPGESSTDPTPADEAGEEESTDPKTCPIIPGRETTIEIEKGRTGLGLSIVGGADTLLGAIIVHEVYEEGAAARDGRLWAGDQILEVNYEDLKDATHDYAIQVLRQTPSTVQIKVFRDDSQVKEEDIYDIFSVELTKKPGRGLGLSIVGKRNDVGVYISDIVKGGTAEADGRLMQGDQILAVNKEDMRNATQEYAAAVLKTLMGKVSLTVGRLKAGSRASSRKNSTPGSALKKSESSVSNKSKGGKHSKSHSEDLAHIRVVELEHDITGSLGLSIAGGIGSSIGDTAVIIANMTPAGPAAKSQKLKIGDQILSINDVQLDGMSHDEVVQLLKKPGTIKLTVSHGEETRVSVSGHTSRQVSTDMSHEYAELMAQDNVFQETLAPDEGPPPQCKTLHLNKGPEGLGFSIVGGHGSPHGDLPIYVKSVFSKGAAADEGSLKRGDQIISVNGQSLEGCTHDEAVSILKNTRGAVTMTVLTS